MRFFILILSIILVVSCRQAAVEAKADAEVTGLVSQEAAEFPTLPKLISLHKFTEAKAVGWGPFQGMHQQMVTLQDVFTSEALALKLEEIETACRDFEAAPFPVVFDKPAVRSRAKVVRTFVQKTRADLYYREDYAPDLIQVVRTYNALLRQLNQVAQEESPEDLPF
jgi:hypothetical protein